jgi:hypothetical protein
MPPTLAMLRERLSRCTISQVLLELSQIAGLLKTWQNDTDRDTDRALTAEFLPSYIQAIKRFRTDKHIVFSRITLLYVAKQACIACQPDQGELVRPAPGDVESMYSCCLMANDLIAERHATGVDTTLEKAVSLLPLANYIPHNTYPRNLARNLLVFEEVAPRLRDMQGYRDLTVDFINATGVPPRDFCELAFTASIKFLAKLKPGDSFVLKHHFLQHSSIPPEHITAFFKKLSVTPTDLQAFARRQEDYGTDFLAFQRYPLVQVNNEAYLCPDPGFLLDKFGRSLLLDIARRTAPESKASTPHLLVVAYRAVRALALRPDLSGTRQGNTFTAVFQWK